MSAPRVAAKPASSIPQLAFALGYHRDGELPMFANGTPNPTRMLPCKDIVRSGHHLAEMAARLDLEESAEVCIGLPLIGGYVYSVTVLHVWVKGSDQLKRAARFTPAPSIVLKMGAGSERLMLWVLKKPVTTTIAEVYNSRIAYALHAPRTRVKPESLRVPMPGTFLRHGRSKPVPVLLTRLHFETGLHFEAVAGELRDPPPKDAWKNRKAA
jgi:hypothetical protein